MTKSARRIAADWRACPALRDLIEICIAANNRGDEFARDRDDNLIARLTNGDWDRIVRSGGGAFMPASLRREQPEWEEACRIVAGLDSPSLLRAGTGRETVTERKAA